MDARLMPGDRLVNVKYISSYFHPDEIAVVEYLNNLELRNERNNHCVPMVCKALHQTQQTSFLVTPLLRPYDDPQFGTVGEVVSFLDQLFKVCLNDPKLCKV